MCKRSKEIQAQWAPKAGDFYADMDSSVLCWVPGGAQSRSIKNGFGIESGKKVTRIYPLVWLPKLDQLIELSQIPGTGFREVSFEFYEWVKRPYGTKQQPANRFFDTLEKLWLSFLMNRKYLKYWINEDWG